MTNATAARRRRWISAPVTLLVTVTKSHSANSKPAITSHIDEHLPSEAIQDHRAARRHYRNRHARFNTRVLARAQFGYFHAYQTAIASLRWAHLNERENKVTTKHTSRNRLRKQVAALAISATLFAACGSTSQALLGPAQNEQRAAVVHDPSNPYWVGSAVNPGDLGASTQSLTRASLVRDPENPYWLMSHKRAESYADPVRGDH